MSTNTFRIHFETNGSGAVKTRLEGKEDPKDLTQEGTMLVMILLGVCASFGDKQFQEQMFLKGVLSQTKEQDLEDTLDKMTPEMKNSLAPEDLLDSLIQSKKNKMN